MNLDDITHIECIEYTTGELVVYTKKEGMNCIYHTFILKTPPSNLQLEKLKDRVNNGQKFTECYNDFLKSLH